MLWSLRELLRWLSSFCNCGSMEWRLIRLVACGILIRDGLFMDLEVEGSVIIKLNILCSCQLEFRECIQQSPSVLSSQNAGTLNRAQTLHKHPQSCILSSRHESSAIHFSVTIDGELSGTREQHSFQKRTIFLGLKAAGESRSIQRNRSTVCEGKWEVGWFVRPRIPKYSYRGDSA